MKGLKMIMNTQSMFYVYFYSYMVYKLDVSDCANIVCNDEIGMVTIFLP